jgi:hypothetical protein
MINFYSDQVKPKRKYVNGVMFGHSGQLNTSFYSTVPGDIRLEFQLRYRLSLSGF